MFTLELDLIIIYTPPMIDSGDGIHLTREVQLPFPPFAGLEICGRQIDQSRGSEGLDLKAVCWDLDRKVFLGHLELSVVDLPMAEIPAELKSWIHSGWRLGSYADRYNASLDQGGDVSTAQERVGESYDWDAMLQQPTLPPEVRPKEVTLVMQAMVRVMVEQHNAVSVAYAMDKTRRYFSPSQLESASTEAADLWRAAITEYEAMDWKQRIAWYDRVVETHPSPEALIQ